VDFQKHWEVSVVYGRCFQCCVVGFHDENGNFILGKMKNLGSGWAQILFRFSVANAWDFGTPHMFDARLYKIKGDSTRIRLATVSLWKGQVG